MQFGDPIASGLYLVREALRSPNYQPGGPGWTVNADGTSEFYGVTVRGDITSVDYVQDESGWGLISATNTAEFNEIKVRDNGLTPGVIRFTNFSSIGEEITLYTGLFSIRNSGYGFSIKNDDGTDRGILAVRPDRIVADCAATYIDFGTDSGASLFVGDCFTGGTFGYRTVLNGNQLRAETAAGLASRLYLNFSNQPVQIGTNGNSAGSGDHWNSIAAGSYFHINWTTGHPVALGGNVLIGNDLTLTGAVTGDFRINGQMDCIPPTAGATANCNLNATGGRYRLRLNTSSRRYKGNIANLYVDIAQVLELKPRTFTRNDDRDPVTDEILPMTPESPRYVGFIAEEAEELGLTGWVTRNGETGEIEGFSYDLFVVAHQAVLRAQQLRIEALEERVTRLERLLTNGH